MLLNELRLRIIEEFIIDYKIQLTGSYIAEKKGFNQKSVSNALLELEKEGFLKSKSSGKNKLFSMNLDNKENIINFISAVEHLRIIMFYNKNTLIKEIAGKIKESCSGIILIFGSYAKNKQKKDSDLDVFVAGKVNSKKIDQLSEIYRISINVKNYPISIFEKNLRANDILLNEIKKDHVIISGAEKFVSVMSGFENENN